MGSPPGPDDAWTRCPCAPLLLAVIFPVTDDSFSPPPSQLGLPTVLYSKTMVAVGIAVGTFVAVGGGSVGRGRGVLGGRVGSGVEVGSGVGGTSVGSGVEVGSGVSVGGGMGVKVGRCAARVTRARVAVGSAPVRTPAVRQANIKKLKPTRNRMKWRDALRMDNWNQGAPKLTVPRRHWSSNMYSMEGEIWSPLSFTSQSKYEPLQALPPQTKSA